MGNSEEEKIRRRNSFKKKEIDMLNRKQGGQNWKERQYINGKYRWRIKILCSVSNILCLSKIWRQNTKQVINRGSGGKLCSKYLSFV